MKAKREREAPEVSAACIRMLRALARRAGEGELEALEALAMLQVSVDQQLGAAVAGYREGPAEASWTTIGSVLGMTRQSAHERWKDSTVAAAWPASSCSCQPGRCNPLECHHCAAAGQPESCPKHTAGLVQL